MKFYILAFLGFLLLVNCGGGSASDATVMGVVKDTDGTVIAGVAATAVGTSSEASTTDADGYFKVINLPDNNHQVVAFSKAGYVSTYKVSRTQSGQNNFISVTMPAIDTTVTFASSVAKVATSNGSTISIPANAFITTSSGAAYSGNVTVHFTSLDPTTTAGFNSFPGEFIGVAADGTASPLISYGFAAITATGSSGEALNLASGKTVTLTIPIPATLLADAPATMPLWHFNETTGVWEAAGTGTKSGSNYTGTLTSFSHWSFEFPFTPAYVTGRVTDCLTDAPVKGAIFCLMATGYGICDVGIGDDGVFPNANVYYDAPWKGLPVEPNAPYTMWAEKDGLKSTVYHKTSGASNSVTALGDICVYSFAATTTYDCTFNGCDGSGTFDLTVLSSGSISGSGVNTTISESFKVNGKVLEDGAITFTATGIKGAVFEGTIDVADSTVTGTWINDEDGAGGFTCTKK